MPKDNSQRILQALSEIGLDWSLCFIGEDQPAKLGRLSAELRKPKSANGNGKRVPSGYAYWGIVPTVAWRDTCQDEFYTVMSESIKNFPKSWNILKKSMCENALHYVSLGPGTGEKDNTIVRTLTEGGNQVLFFPIDMSPEMLRLGTKRAVQDTRILRGNVLPIQIDFSVRENIEEIAKLLGIIVEDEPVLFSLLGNTLSNFEDDEELLSTIALLLRPQDQLLLEVATTSRVTSEASAAAAAEYDKSVSFKHFVSSSLVQNTNLPVDIKNVEFLHDIEANRAVLVKTVYRNSSPTTTMSVGNREPVQFAKNDTIRLSTMRKYSPHGIRSLLAGAGLRVVQKVEKSQSAISKGGANFGSTLMLLESGEVPRDDVSWDFFIAHADPDKAIAKELHDALCARSARVFLDSVTLRLGDAVHKKLSKAQAKSLVSVILISDRTEDAYYEQEEIAAAIALARHDDAKHRVVPVYIGEAGDLTKIPVPYGLRLKLSADLRTTKLSVVAEQLMECLSQ